MQAMQDEMKEKLRNYWECETRINFGVSKFTSYTNDSFSSLFLLSSPSFDLNSFEQLHSCPPTIPPSQKRRNPLRWHLWQRCPTPLSLSYPQLLFFDHYPLLLSPPLLHEHFFCCCYCCDYYCCSYGTVLTASVEWDHTDDEEKLVSKFWFRFSSDCTDMGRLGSIFLFTHFLTQIKSHFHFETHFLFPWFLLFYQCLFSFCFHWLVAQSPPCHPCWCCKWTHWLWGFRIFPDFSFHFFSPLIGFFFF